MRRPGDRLRSQHRAADAEAAYREAIELDPRLPRAHFGLGRVLRDTKRYGEAEAECREAIRLDPDLAAAHVNLGLILRQIKRYTEADTAFAEAIRLDPDRVALETYLRVQRSSWLKGLRMRRRGAALLSRLTPVTAENFGEQLV